MDIVYGIEVVKTQRSTIKTQIRFRLVQQQQLRRTGQHHL